MTIDPGSDGWYYDERTSPSRSSAPVWTYGIEVWCNLEGQYVHIVADLSHLIGSYTMSLCSVGIMGASLVRDEPLPTSIEIFQGQSMSVGVPHFFDEFTGIQEYTINLRQVTSSELAFVTISEEDGQSIVHIDPEGIPFGDYELKLESFDALSSS